MHLGNIECRLEGYLYEVLLADSSAVDANQTNLNVELSTKLGTKLGGSQKSGGHGHPVPPLESSNRQNFVLRIRVF